METDNSRYIRALLRGWWLIVLAAAVAGGGAYLLRSREAPQYVSEARIFIGNTITNPDPSVGQIDTGQRLAVTYAQLITYELLEDTINQLGLSESPELLRSMVSTQVVAETPILQINATYTDAQKAADIANTIAAQLVTTSPSYLTEEQRAQMRTLQDQIKDLENQITVSNQRSLEALAELNTAIESGDQTTVEERTRVYNQLVEQTNSSRSILAQLSSTLLSLTNRTNQLVIIERARPALRPSGLSPFIALAAGAMAGVILAAAILMLREQGNTTVRNADEVDERSGLRALGEITRTRLVRRNRFVVERMPESPEAEAYRAVATKLRSYLRMNPSSRVFVVTSPGAGEGKTTTAINIAGALALSGLRVLLVDSDLRAPTVGKVFAIEDEMGFGWLLSVDPTTVFKVVHATSIPNLGVLPGGQAMENPGNLLGSSRVSGWIDALVEFHAVDCVVIDAPPCLDLADVPALALATNASAVLVADAGRTQWEALLKAKDLLEQIGTDIVGVILNRYPRRDLRQRRIYRTPGYGSPVYEATAAPRSEDGAWTSALEASSSHAGSEQGEPQAGIVPENADHA
ncbi:MAG: polysaccharide biosynthesis tyrosine autokinase [Anaerolineae bacterium]|nr:polysaccharide biosynthesis tyrosine autokinase [Anaerolineae bacterium]